MSGVITGLDKYESAADKHRDWRDVLNLSIFGTDTESAIKGRKLKNGKIEANLWDRVVGNSTEELTAAAQKRRAEAIKNSEVGGSLLAEGRDIDIDSTDQSLRKQYKDVNAENAAIDALVRTGGYIGNINDLKGKGANYINSLIPDAQNTAYSKRPDIVESNNRYKAQQLYQQGRDKVTDQRYALEQERLWQDKQENRKDRALTRQMTAENNAMQMQLEYARLAQQDKQNAKDRKDKVIMMLLQGLGNLGTAFTI